MEDVIDYTPATIYLPKIAVIIGVNDINTPFNPPSPVTKLLIESKNPENTLFKPIKNLSLINDE
jgi:hypothetical protein